MCIRDRFSSAWKYMVTSARKKDGGEEIIVIKGAPEVVSKIIKDETYMKEVSKQQDRGRRAISAAMISGADFDSIKEKLDAKEALAHCTYIGTWSVSYTHLDVYKRQAIMSIKVKNFIYL